MKRILLFFTCCVVILTCIASDLQILRVRGNVRIKNIDGSYSPVKSRVGIEESAILIIPTDASVAILNKDSNSVYYSPDSGGELSVKTIIKKARRNADRTTARITDQMLRALEGENGHKNQKGVSYRDQGSDSGREKAIAVKILSHSFDEKYPVKVSRIENADSIWHYAIDNDSDSLLYMNIISISDDGRPSLVLPVSHEAVLLPPGRLELSQYPFYGLMPDRLYFLGSAIPFDSGLINLLLGKLRPDSTVPNFDDLILSPFF